MSSEEIYKLVIFQSTPSVGRATLLGVIIGLNRVISIHALRGEGDASGRDNWLK